MGTTHPFNRTSLVFYPAYFILLLSLSRPVCISLEFLILLLNGPPLVCEADELLEGGGRRQVDEVVLGAWRRALVLFGEEPDFWREPSLPRPNDLLTPWMRMAAPELCAPGTAAACDVMVTNPVLTLAARRLRRATC